MSLEDGNIPWKKKNNVFGAVLHVIYIYIYIYIWEYNPNMIRALEQDEDMYNQERKDAVDSLERLKSV